MRWTSRLFGVLGGSAFTACLSLAVNAQCTGPQAPVERLPDGTPLYVKPGQNFHLNLTGLNNLPPEQASAILNGLTEWAGINGITFDYSSTTPGSPGTIYVHQGSGFNSDGFGQWSAGGGGYPANQITGGDIQFDLGYVVPGPPSFPAFDPNGSDAADYLRGLGSHEMGHVLGLNDTPDAGTQQQTSNSTMGGDLGTNNRGGAPTSKTPNDCDKQTEKDQGNSAGAAAGSGGGSGGGDGSGGSGGGGFGGGSGGGGGGCSGYSEWDDSTNTLTYY